MNRMLDQAHITSLFENATEGIIVTDRKGNIVLLNPAAEKMFGYQSNELIDKNIETLIPDQFRKHHAGHREGFYHNPSNRVMGHGRDLYGKKQSGENIPVEVSLSHYNRDGELFVIAFVVDITTRKEIERSMLKQQTELEKVTTEIRKLNADLELKVEQRTMILKEALQRLEQSQKELSEALDKERQLSEIKSRFVSMASHEFRTPLSTVLSSASLLEKYKTTEDQDKRTRHIDKIKNSVRHLNEILEDFLSLGKLDEGKVGIHLSEFDLKAFIEETADEMKGLLKKDQRLVFRYKGDILINSDKRLLKNILINLITNAMKFSDEGKEIVIEAEINGNQAIVSVEDQGIGIGREDL
ncbi:MAG: PAS domain-containing sensor histidine kinase, partial [Chitinophagaceae bacterium]|nr:PAS domain-containing sensor histidine kinase [Chitinophagaceae bacterium]